jgi:N-acetylglucosamine-6-phosphate deacetylase
MADHWITPTQVFSQGRLLRHHALRVSAGRITALSALDTVADGLPQVPVAGVLTPGFVDVQVNGGGGTLFNADPTLDGIKAIIAAHRRFGTVALMPTVITDHPDVLARAVQAAHAAKGLHGFAGLHIEGPHIAAARRGTHAAAYLRPLDDHTLALVAGLRAAGIAVMITLAPEQAQLSQIAALDRMGAIVALGHSDATAAQAGACFAAGARAVTHLFNAMSQMQGRAAGLVGAALNSHATIGLICDGVHVADEMVALALRACAPNARMMLVSDAMPTVGGPDHFDLYGARIQLQDGRLINAEGNLAGAHGTMASGLARLVGQIGQPLEQALQMAISTPAALLCADHLAQIQGRALADLIVLDDAGVIRQPPQ